MSAEAVPFVFRSAPGESIFGILHPPEDGRGRGIGVSLMNPGLKSRVAPNRLNVVAARRLARLGYWVLRVDPPGVGDSGGAIPEAFLPEIWQDVQKGLFVEAFRESHRVFAERCALDEIVGMGNCGGAITALFEGADDPLVRRVVLVDVPVTLRDVRRTTGARIHGRGHARSILRAYARRMVDWRAWWNLLRFRTDLKTVGRALRTQLPVSDSGAPGAPSAPPGDEVLSEPFLEALRSFDSRGGRALFVTAGNDDNTFAFDERFAREHWDRGLRIGARHERLTIPESNHIYGDREWREALLTGIENWLDRTENSAGSPASGGRDGR